eukprot:202926_1
MPQLLESCIVCRSNDHLTIVPVTKSEILSDALLISFWCYFTDLNRKSNSIILSIHPSSSNIFSRLFISSNNNNNKKLFKNIVLKIDNKTNSRLSLEINNNEINIPIKSIKSLKMFSWNHITFIISYNPLIILFKLNNEYFETKLIENINLYDLDL